MNYDQLHPPVVLYGSSRAHHKASYAAVQLEALFGTSDLQVFERYLRRLMRVSSRRERVGSAVNCTREKEVADTSASAGISAS